MYWNSVLGGLAIGAGTSFLMLGAGRIAGITGIVATALQGRRQHVWATVFLFGLIMGGWLGLPQGLPPPGDFNLMESSRYLAGGLIVGIGTRLGNGCTSGHGICGIARFSYRSILATLIFMTTGSLTATLLMSH